MEGWWAGVDDKWMKRAITAGQTQAEHQGLLGWQHTLWCCNGGYMLVHIVQTCGMDDTKSEP